MRDDDDPFKPTSLESGLEQFETVMINFSKVEYNYKKALVECGFTDDQAMQLVLQWKSVWLERAFGARR